MKTGVLIFAHMIQTDVVYLIDSSCIQNFKTMTFCTTGTFEVKTKNDISLAPKLHCCIKYKLQRIIMCLSVRVTTFLPWVLPTGGVACAACLMAHIISSMRTPSSSYIRPDNTEVQTGAELSGWWLRIHNAGTTREQHEGYAAETACGVYTVLSCCSPVSCSRNAVIVSQSLSSDPATPHRLSTRYVPCSWNCQESGLTALD